MKKNSKNPTPSCEIVNSVGKKYFSYLFLHETKGFSGRYGINKGGFSLVELLLVLTIIGIMSVLTATFVSATRKSVEVAAREVATVVRETQNYALTGKDLTAASVSCAYTLSWTSGSANYGITGCRTQGHTLKNGVKFSNGGSISFSVPSAVISPNATADIQIDRSASNRYHICVYVSGIVAEKAISDPC